MKFPASIIFGLVLFSCTSQKVQYQYTFDKDIGDLHPTSHKNPWAYQLDSSVVRSGKKSIRFEVRKGDYRISKSGSKSSRAELSTEKMAEIGNEYWYALSMFIPEDFPIEDNRLVLAQWWAEPDLGEYSDRSPILAMRFRNGKFYISLRTSSEKIMKENGKEIVLYESTDFALGKWKDFIFQIKWSYKNDGLVNTWINNNQIIQYNGPVGYNDKNGPALQFGIYRDETKKTYVVYFDEVKMGTSKAISIDSVTF